LIEKTFPQSAAGIGKQRSDRTAERASWAMSAALWVEQADMPLIFVVERRNLPF
jgi:hypothetical protein